MRETVRGYLWLLLTIVLFSTYEVVGRVFAQDLHPLFVNAFRFSFGGLVLLPFAWPKIREQKLRLGAKEYVQLAGLGLLNTGLCMGLMQFSLRYTEASTAAVLLSSNPLIVSVLSIFIFGEPMTKNKLGALAIGMVGMVFVAGGLSLQNAVGPLLAAAASVVWAVYTVLGKTMALRHGSLVVNAISFLLGGLCLFTVLAVTRIPVGELTITNTLLLTYLAIFVTGLAYYAFFTGLSYLDTTAGSAVFFLKPVLASLLAALLLDEPLSGTKVFGTVLILAAMALVVRPFGLGAAKVAGTPKTL